MYLYTMAEWLTRLQSIHPLQMDLKLERVKEVASRLGLLKPSCPVIIVAGTNGKGSTVAALSSIYRAAGLNVGTFTSPFLFSPNEQVCINGNEASDEAFCAAFNEIESARKNITLTKFEFFTLAALILFHQYTLQLWILEVGLGGRLDAVNILDADIAIITSIDLDHTDILGSTREQIAIEKAGVLRRNQLAVCGDPSPPSTLIHYARALNTSLFIQGKDFYSLTHGKNWEWVSASHRFSSLPFSPLHLQNLAAAIMAVQLLQNHLPISERAIHQGIKEVTLPARIQVIEDEITQIYDVAHNPAAIAHLANYLCTHPIAGKTIAVFSMLADKDITQSLKMMHGTIDRWYTAPLHTPRAASSQSLLSCFREAGVQKEITLCSSIPQAFQSAQESAVTGDRLIIFGSFHTVAQVLLER